MAALAPMAALPLSGRARAMSSRSIAQPVPVSNLRAKARKATVGVRAASGATGSIREQAGRRGKSWKMRVSCITRHNHPTLTMIPTFFQILQTLP